MKRIKQADRKHLRDIVNQIYLEREALSLSQKELASRAGIHSDTIARVESNENTCYSLPTLIALCKIFEVPLSDLLKKVNL